MRHVWIFNRSVFPLLLQFLIFASATLLYHVYTPHYSRVPLLCVLQSSPIRWWPLASGTDVSSEMNASSAALRSRSAERQPSCKESGKVKKCKCLINQIKIWDRINYIFAWNSERFDWRKSSFYPRQRGNAVNPKRAEKLTNANV